MEYNFLIQCWLLEYLHMYVCMSVDNGEGTMSWGKFPWKVSIGLSVAKSVCGF